MQDPTAGSALMIASTACDREDSSRHHIKLSDLVVELAHQRASAQGRGHPGSDLYRGTLPRGEVAALLGTG